MSLSECANTTELQIACALVDRALASGYAISVDDGEATTVTRSTNRTNILTALGTTGDDHLTFYSGSKRLGFIWLIWGNDIDLISDHTANADMEALVAGLGE